MAYVARQFEIPKTVQELAEILVQELRAIQEATEETDSIVLNVLHVAPDKVVPGMMVYADGTDWNPGSGQGTYVRNKDNSAWRFLG